MVRRLSEATRLAQGLSQRYIDFQDRYNDILDALVRADKPLNPEQAAIQMDYLFRAENFGHADDKAHCLETHISGMYASLLEVPADANPRGDRKKVITSLVDFLEALTKLSRRAEGTDSCTGPIILWHTTRHFDAIMSGSFDTVLNKLVVAVEPDRARHVLDILVFAAELAAREVWEDPQRPLNMLKMALETPADQLLLKSDMRIVIAVSLLGHEAATIYGYSSIQKSYLSRMGEKGRAEFEAEHPPRHTGITELVPLASGGSQILGEWVVAVMNGIEAKYPSGEVPRLNSRVPKFDELFKPYMMLDNPPQNDRSRIRLSV
ncbi:uncharacterized protein BO97DRAFT_425911 [Aspergillus homomorphus CBS 101889]|uniref:Uncharacterized protein n=1 Tax=Aspergillus homomorphus (strain CBS 101889) TaxID=1450537 RepID=A0A395HTT1_ASPHC|nr:hypothetical protein BO97DRAFT_425911 [Aspergillus homomorphus CBS 101889]RAL10956.1 hypothetical protein BO97DRAFT_425911 [Aspergillus homomorphus CBS 101889]